MDQKIKKIVITAAHFSEIRGFWEILGFEKRDLKGKTATVSRFGKEITLIIVGIGYNGDSGPVNEFLKRLSRTDVVLNVGSAGSLDPELKPGDCFIPDTFVTEDEEGCLGTLRLKLQDLTRNVLNILKDKEIKSRSGTLFTGKEEVASSQAGERLRTLYHASAVDMEAYHLVEAASKEGIPFLALKIISDRANRSVKDDFKKALPTVSAKIGKILIEILKSC